MQTQTKNKPNNMLLFFVAAALFNVAANFAHPVTPTFIQEYQLDSYMFGVALAVMQCSYFLMSPFWGKLNNYIDSRKSMLICALGYSVGQALTLFPYTTLFRSAKRFSAWPAPTEC